MLNDYTVKPEKGKIYIPKIELGSSGIFKIIGSSFMENPLHFYEPLFEWIGEFMKSGKAIELHLLPDYYNTSSAKCVDRLIRTLKSYKDTGNQAKVFWYYEENDSDNLDDGEDYQALVDIPFEIISFQGKEYPISIA